jgi:homoserine dehydrogenase
VLAEEDDVKTYDLVLIGFGVVNRALARLIIEEPDRFRSLGFELRVTAIADLAMGSTISPTGIDLAAAMALPRGLTFEEIGGSSAARTEDVIRSAKADIAVEATFTNGVTGEPAASHVRWALDAGMHVVTTNKGPIALHGAELRARASADRCFLFEGSVLSGTPLLGLVRDTLAGTQITAVRGVLNGTSNFVLERMEAGERLEQSVAEAQARGYAEADPSADLNGSDVRLKVTILANELMNAGLTPDQVTTTGIESISASDIIAAARDRRRWKLIGEVHREVDGTVTASVQPVALDTDDPLIGISGATNAVSVTTDLLGPVTITGPGAGATETAFALLADIITIHSQSKDLSRA